MPPGLVSRTSAVIGAALLVLPWMYLMWNTIVGEIVPSLRFRTNGTIAGVLQGAVPKLTLENLVNYRFQRQVSEEIGRLSPVYATAIRAKAQLYYWAFGVSPNPAVVIGRDGQLFQRPYVEEYCGRNLAGFTPRSEAWAARIRDMQDFFTGRGQQFLYVITPSKAAAYPEYIPPGYSCPSSAADRAGKLDVWRAALVRAGVRFIDGPRIIAAAKAAGDIYLYPKSGIHWSALGSARGAAAFTTAVNAQGGPVQFAGFSWDVRISPTPHGDDRDVLDILNVPWPNEQYPVPEVTFHSDPPTSCRAAHIAEVGGSFLFGLNEALSQLACPPEIDMWFYWTHKHFHYPPASGASGPVDPERRQALLDAADLVVFEENEAVLPESEQGPPLLREIEKRRK